MALLKRNVGISLHKQMDDSGRKRRYQTEILFHELYILKWASNKQKRFVNKCNQALTCWIRRSWSNKTQT